MFFEDVRVISVKITPWQRREIRLRAQSVLAVRFETEEKTLDVISPTRRPSSLKAWHKPRQ